MRISSFREFMIKFTTSRGELNIRYGYSTSANNSGFYIEGSLNNGKYSRSNKMLALIKSLKIDAFDKLIAHMNKNVYGVGEDIMSASFDFFTKSAACNDAINITEAISLFGFDSNDNDDDVDALTEALNSFIKQTSFSRKCQISDNYVFRRMMIGLRKSRELVQELRQGHLYGFTTPKSASVETPNLISENTPKHYYKRDIDYIRKARVRVCQWMNKRYTPFDK